MGPMGNGGTGDMRYRAMGHMGNGIQGVWGIWAMRPTGGYGYRGMGTGGMGYKGYGPCGQWDTGLWATWAMGPMGDLLPKYQKDGQVVKKMSSCQKDVKCEQMKHLDYGGGSQKN